MDTNEKISLRVSELIAKYSTSSESIQYLLCDQYPANKLAYKIINENMFWVTSEDEGIGNPYMYKLELD